MVIQDYNSTFRTFNQIFERLLLQYNVQIVQLQGKGYSPDSVEGSRVADIQPGLIPSIACTAEGKYCTDKVLQTYLSSVRTKLNG